MHIVVIDLGTSRIKAVVFNAAGEQVAHASRPCPLVRPQPGWCEQDMAETLASALDTLRECIARLALPASAYAALALTGQGDGTRLIDADGQPVRPAITWQDARAAPIIRRWQADGSARDVLRLTGAVLSGSQQTAQLAWLAEHEPEALQRARYIFFAKDWLFHHLTGVPATDQSDSSYTYLNRQTRQFDRRILEVLDLAWVADKLPPMLPPERPTAPLLAQAAGQLGLPGGLPVVAAPFDVVSEMIGVGGFRAGVACSVMGTAGIHQLSIEPAAAEPPDTLAGYTTYIPGQPTLIRFIPNMLAVPNIEFWAAVLYADWPHRPPAFTGDADFEAQLAAVPPGADGVRYLPFLSPAGERSPRFMPEARAAFTGLSLHHRREHLLRAVYEGIALAAADSFAHLPASAAAVQLTGGGARSPLLAQIMADMLEQPVEVRRQHSGAVYGAMLFARAVLGHAPDLNAAYHQIQPTSRIYTPDLPASAIYRALKSNYDALIPLAHPPPS